MISLGDVFPTSMAFGDTVRRSLILEAWSLLFPRRRCRKHRGRCAHDEVKTSLPNTVFTTNLALSCDKHTLLASKDVSTQLGVNFSLLPTFAEPENF